MTPEQFSARLREMADKIDRSAKPSIALVAGELHELAGEITEETYDVELAHQEGVQVGRSKRPATLSLDVSRRDAFDSTMKGFQRRASKR